MKANCGHYSWVASTHWKGIAEHACGHKSHERGHLVPDSVVLDSWEIYREIVPLPLLQVHTQYMAFKAHVTAKQSQNKNNADAIRSVSMQPN